MSDYPINLDQETKNLLKEFIHEFKELNENLADLKKMVAPVLGFRIKKDND